MTVRSRDRVTTRVFAGLALAATIAVLVAACSPGADYPTILDKPMPRADQPMSPDQVQQATSALISDRDRLSAEAAQANAPATTGSTRTAGAAPKP